MIGLSGNSTTFFLACDDAYCQSGGWWGSWYRWWRPTPRGSSCSDMAGRAAKEVKDELLQVSWVPGSFVPKNKPDIFKDLNSRLQEESCLTIDGKPTIVFYTAENALKRSKPTREAEASQKAYKKLFDVSREETCILTHFVTMVKIDISNITPEKDSLLNNKTAPLLVFYKTDGTYAEFLSSNSINDRNFCWIVTKLLNERGINANKTVRHFQEYMDKIKPLAKKRYSIDKEYSKLEKNREKKPAIKIKLKEEMEELQAQSDVLSKEINVMKAKALEPILCSDI